MSVILGIAGASRNAALALCHDGRVVGVCEHARITRTRRAALKPGQLPRETLKTLLQLGSCTEQDISAYAAAEQAIQLPDRQVAYIDHHLAHAATAFYSSPFTDATIIVCDRNGDPELTVWRGDGSGIRRADFPWTGPAFASVYTQAAEAMGFGHDGSGIRRADFPWTGPAFASVYTQAAEAMGFGHDGDEHRFEALARVGEHRHDAGVPTIAYRDGDHLDVPTHFQASIAGIVGRNGSAASAGQRASLAEQIQRQLGELLLAVVSDIGVRVGITRLCLGGGLFYNSYFTTLLAESGLCAETFVPANPGNAGVAVGAALAVAAEESPLPRREPLSPFLGPEFSAQDIKAVLDNCKLSYDYLRSGQVIERTTAALAKGQLVGWFQGRMEWGPRALGHRSILASPVAPYVLENLNLFLKQRKPHETYSVVVRADDVHRYFRGPAKSSLMEYEYEVLDRELLRSLLPANATRLRVQTVDESAGAFYELIRAFGEATGVPMLVNTSFNGFNEPIVCSPRDAIRVFYGTGLDLAVIGNLVLVK